jgi:hypothetical protein
MESDSLSTACAVHIQSNSHQLSSADGQCGTHAIAVKVMHATLLGFGPKQDIRSTQDQQQHEYIQHPGSTTTRIYTAPRINNNTNIYSTQDQ